MKAEEEIAKEIVNKFTEVDVWSYDIDGGGYICPKEVGIMSVNLFRKFINEDEIDWDLVINEIKKL